MFFEKIFFCHITVIIPMVMGVPADVNNFQKEKMTKWKSAEKSFQGWRKMAKTGRAGRWNERKIGLFYNICMKKSWKLINPLILTGFHRRFSTLNLYFCPNIVENYVETVENQHKTAICWKMQNHWKSCWKSVNTRFEKILSTNRSWMLKMRRTNN